MATAHSPRWRQPEIYALTSFKQSIRQLARRWLPRSTRHRLGQLGQWPPVGLVRYGNLRRLRPISDDWGSRRGLPIDRYYIEHFLARHASDIRGRALEVRDRSYTVRFGGERVTQSDVLHKLPGNPEATIVADLEAIPPALPAETFDAIICTQTLQFIYDVKTAVSTLYHSLKPGGVLLITLPAISQISRSDMEQWGDYWRFTSLAARLLLQEQCPGAAVEVGAYGNVLTAVASLHGIASNELRQRELDAADPDYEFLITARVQKPEAAR
jgi:SAM-dependent methyltransferase